MHIEQSIRKYAYRTFFLPAAPAFGINPRIEWRLKFPKVGAKLTPRIEGVLS
jgi:hypothetical protein